MIFNRVRQNLVVKDEDFNSIYPFEIVRHASRHWTPVEVAKSASHFLSPTSGSKILDIGSGVGKFCFVGACHTKGTFHGVEYRPWMNDLANKLAWQHRIRNVKFFGMNMNELSFKDYSAFYFFNPFLENLDATALVDDKVIAGKVQYEKYVRYFLDQMNISKTGTRLATYWSGQMKLPVDFRKVETLFDGNLILWEKN